jgi:hypothetical protein
VIAACSLRACNWWLADLPRGSAHRSADLIHG